MHITLKRPLPEGVGRVTQWFGDTLCDYSRYEMVGHSGVDYGAPSGTPVLAAHAGVVTTGNDPNGYGRWVRVRGEGYQTIYAHMRRVVVTAGATVEAGAQIGEVGSTGNSTGPHLHFGLKLDGGRNPGYAGWIDPVPFRKE